MIVTNESTRTNDNQESGQNWQADVDKSVRGEGRRRDSAADDSAHHQENENGDNDGAESHQVARARRPWLDPSQFPEPTQHHDRSPLANRMTSQFQKNVRKSVTRMRFSDATMNHPRSPGRRRCREW